jgi:hypothetical protein
MDNIGMEFKTYLKNIYKKLTYLDQYAGSIVLTGLTIFVFFLIFSYYYTMSHIKPIKADWVNRRCSPPVIPFAGLINKSPDTTVFDFTSQNFHDCIVIAIKDSIGLFLTPIHALANTMTDLYNDLLAAVQNLRKLFARIRNAIMSIVENIIHRITNVLIQLQRLIIVMKDALGQTQGTLTAALYTVLGSYLAMKAFFGAFLQLLILMLILLAAAIIIMWIFPWTWEIASVMTAFFIILVVPTSIMAYWLNRILDLTSGSVPPAPSKCFDGDTLIPLKRGMVPIKEVKVGDTLAKGGKVTAFIKCSSYGEKIYNLKNIVVTGSHGIVLDNGGWLNVADHPAAVEIKNYNKPFVYCLNTSTKVITLNDINFADWDEVDAEDILKLRWLIRDRLPHTFSNINIHEILDGGFVGDTIIEVSDGNSICLRDIKVNDELKSGERVLGIVQIDARDLKNIKEYYLSDTIFIGGPNIRVNDECLGEFSTLDIMGTRVEGPDKLYHIITNTGFVTICGVRFYDYNGGLEPILWKKDTFLKKLL